MERIAIICLQSFLKALNLIMGIVGISMILYGIWMIRVWQRDMEGQSFDDFCSINPWFICSFIGIGVTFCLITCLGHIAAASANGFCLSFYMLITCLLLLLETAIAADIQLNSEWEKDLPDDPTGRFHDFKKFVKSNFDIFKWIGIWIISAQVSSALLAMALRALVSNQGYSYDNDGEFLSDRLPLINHQVQAPAYVIGDPHFAAKYDPVKPTAYAWNVKIHFNPSQLFLASFLS
ncbi:tetraspanin-19 isoform X1 [Citrus clementina]|uniref:tetraspanin-19 isoform X1 n=1 Tax=Citrus clementina TaxID=85681 RepID=UPI000CED25A5|nr:tetraspanin-19 isoform X1 [Citrus x clementina]